LAFDGENREASRRLRGHPEVLSYGLLGERTDLKVEVQEYPLVQLPLVDIVYFSKHLLPNTSGRFVRTADVELS